MKAYLFIETGEVKEPIRNQYFICDRGYAMECNGPGFEPRRILTRHEIEVPEEADVLHWHFHDSSGCRLMSDIDDSIPLPRPKKMVKKWRWYIVERDEVTHGRHTEDDIRKLWGGYRLIRIEESMREVPE